VHRIGNPGYNDAKSAFADCTPGIAADGERLTFTIFPQQRRSPVARWVAWESAKADFVLL
jgi:hypothetical protein